MVRIDSAIANRVASLVRAATPAAAPESGAVRAAALPRTLMAGGIAAAALGGAAVLAGCGGSDDDAITGAGAVAPRAADTLNGVSGPIPGVDAPADPPSAKLETIATDLGALVQVTHAPGDDSGLWLVDKTGLVKRRAEDGTVSTKLDISKAISSSGERGLLSIAFHPDFATNGRLFLNFTDPAGDTHVAEARAGANGKVDPKSLEDLMVIDQPYANHNGGQLQVGPDGMLYVGMGDGGSGGDPEDRAQDLGEHLGKILRIDVDHPEGGKPYGIPDDNPFVDTAGAQPEIYATGVRNPWRFSFDPKTGDLYVGDVGQNQFEEVDYVPNGQARGANFGWDVKEASHPNEATPQAPGPLVDPVLEYGRDEGSSITGGAVYRGSKLPALEGYYLYADIASDSLRALKVQDGAVVDRREMPGGRGMTVAFGEGPDQELYSVTLGGELTKVVAD